MVIMFVSRLNLPNFICINKHKVTVYMHHVVGLERLKLFPYDRPLRDEVR